jgi:hypothetical protein
MQSSDRTVTSQHRRMSMPIDRSRILAIFEALGAKLSHPTALCLIGSTPAIIPGQDERQTQDIDVWHPAWE